MRRIAAAWLATAFLVSSGASHGALARAAFNCNGFALLGGAELVCSHTDPQAPTQICTFSWILMKTDDSVQVVQGSFMLVPGVSDATIYQGGGFSYALSNPIVLCQAGGG